MFNYYSMPVDQAHTSNDRIKKTQKYYIIDVVFCRGYLMNFTKLFEYK
jgi:hypothetical protein